MGIHEVAKRAKVSTATVSRTLNKPGTVDPETAKRVWKAVKELQYLPNTTARSLVSGSSRILGLIVSDITNPFFPEVIKGLEDVAIREGYEILISSTNYDLARMAVCVRRMLERKVEGVAVLTFGGEEPVLGQLAIHNVPIVLAEFHLEDPKVSTIVLDYSAGIHAAVAHLFELGHTRIGFLAGPHTLHSAVTRLNAFQQSMSDAGLKAHNNWIIECDHTLKGGVAGFESLMMLKSRPTALICSNDMTAIGVLRAVYMAGLRVPEDLSVIGLDDIDFAEFTLPPLTTIRLSRAELAKAAFDALRVQAENAANPRVAHVVQREFLVSTNLVVRGSTAAPAAEPAVAKDRVLIKS